MTTTEKKTIKITMSERSPLRIDPELWPLIADVSRHDGAVPSQANHWWYIRVREHRDGRRIVYGAYTSGNGGVHVGFREKHGGYLVEPNGEMRSVDDGPLVRTPDEDATIRAIRRVAGIIDDDAMGDECIADLPAQELT